MKTVGYAAFSDDAHMVVTAKQSQGLFVGELKVLPQSQQFAGTIVLICFILHFSVSKRRGRKNEVFVDESNYIIKTDVFRRGV